MSGAQLETDLTIYFSDSWKLLNGFSDIHCSLKRIFKNILIHFFCVNLLEKGLLVIFIKSTIIYTY